MEVVIAAAMTVVMGNCRHRTQDLTDSHRRIRELASKRLKAKKSPNQKLSARKCIFTKSENIKSTHSSEYYSKYTQLPASITELGLSNDEIVKKVLSLYDYGKSCWPWNRPTSFFYDKRALFIVFSLAVTGCSDGKCSSTTERVDGFYLETTVRDSNSYYNGWTLIISNTIPNHCFLV